MVVKGVVGCRGGESVGTRWTRVRHGGSRTQRKLSDKMERDLGLRNSHTTVKVRKRDDREDFSVF